MAKIILLNACLRYPTEAKIPHHIFSLSEAAVKDAHENERHALFAHNKDYMMRTYPSGIRVNSSNLDPSFFWRQGIQIVALNWQNCDKGMMLNKGMFAGSRGWVLKSPEYRGVAPASEPSGAAPSRETQAASANSDGKKLSAVPSFRRTLHLSIEVYAGQNIPLPKGDSHDRSFRPYVSCQLHVEQPKDSIHASAKDNDSNDGGSVKYKTKTKSCSGADPDFGGQMLQFSSAPGVLEELSFVRSVNSNKACSFCFSWADKCFLPMLLFSISYRLGFTPGIASGNPHTPAWPLSFSGESERISSNRPCHVRGRS